MPLSHRFGFGFLLLFIALAVVGGFYIDAVMHESHDFQALKTWRFILTVTFFGLIGLGLITILWFIRRLNEAIEGVATDARRLILIPEQASLPQSPVPDLLPLTGGINELLGTLTEALNELQIQKQNDESVLNAMSEPVIAIDQKGRITLANTAAISLFQFPEYPVERQVNELIRSSDIQNFFAALLHGEVKSEVREVLFYSRPGAEPLNLILSGGALLDRNREQTAALIVINDITRIRQMERVQRDFVANVSHELRTPLTVIRSVVESLQDGAWSDPSASQTFLASLYRNAERLEAIVADLLALSKVENLTETHALQCESFPAAELVANAFRQCSARAQQRNMTLSADLPEGLILYANASLAEQALTNYIDNGIKYSEPGRNICVKAFEEGGKVIFAVKDNGYGISAEHLSRLFDRFYRVDKGRSRQTGGTGLGLSIVRFIAKAHGGETWVSSEPGIGSTFYVSFPLRSLPY